MIYQMGDDVPFLEDYLNMITTVIFIIGLCITLVIFLKKRTPSNLIQVLLMIAGFLLSILELFKLYIIWEDTGSFYGFIIMILLVLFVIKKSKQKLQRLNEDLEQEVEERTRDLKESEEKYRTLVNNIVDIIFEINPNEEFTYLSPQVFDFFGFSLGEMIGYNIDEFIHQEDLLIVKEAFRITFDTERNTAIKCRMMSKAGIYIQVSIRGSLVKDKKFFKIIGIIRDITKQKKAENMIKEQIRKLKEIDQIRSDLVRRTSHELKTPLISIYSSSQYLLDSYKEEMNEDILKFVKVINRGGNRLKRLTENLLDTFDIESKGLVLKKEKLDIVKTIKECINDLIFSLKEKNLFLKDNLDGTLYIEVDKIRIEQVILNLLSNAIKNTPPNGIVSINLKKYANFIDIIIKDTGIGINEDEKEKLFKKFGKIERYNQKKDLDTEGVGLGLYISKEIVELHGGKIWVESDGRNKGSTFIVRLFTHK